MGRAKQSAAAVRAVSRSTLETPYANLAANIDNPEVALIRQIALDLDDTIYPILKAVQQWSTTELDYSLIDKHGALIKYLGGPERANEVFTKAFEFNHSKNIGLLPGTKVALNKLDSYNIDVHAMTHRPNESFDDTKKFLDFYNINYASLHCQSPIDKLAICRDKDIGILVDDKETLMEEAHAEGIDPFSLSLPYNEAVMDKLNIPAARRWDHLVDHLLERIDTKIGIALK